MPQLPLLLVAVNLCATLGLRAIKPNLTSAVVLAVVAIGTTGYLGVAHGDRVLKMLSQGRDRVLAATGQAKQWPPQLGRRFPDQPLVDARGQRTRIDEFRGRVVLLHVVGMPSRTSIAFAGGGLRGPFLGVAPQDNLESIGSYVRQYGNVALDDERLVVVHLLLFNREMVAPSPTELREWERHFHVDQRDNEVVLGGMKPLATAASRAMIPGFLLIDRNSIVRADATGAHPVDDLYRDLLPMIGRLFVE